MEINKKKILLVSVIIVFIVSALGLSYSFFNISTNNTNTANLYSLSKNGSSSFVSRFDNNNVSFNIELEDMKINDTNGYNGKNAIVNLNVSLLSYSNDVITICDYDIIYTWDQINTYTSTNDYYYKKSSTLSTSDKEFTYLVTGSSNVAETQFPDAGINNNTVTILHNRITNQSTNTLTNQNYAIETRFYNLSNKDQIDQNKKVYLGTYSVDNISCMYLNGGSSGYQLLNYLEGSGTQYIDTGFIPNEKTSIDIDFKINATTDNGAFVFGAGGNNYQDQAYELYPWMGKWNLNFGNLQWNPTATVDRVRLVFNNRIIKLYSTSSELIASGRFNDVTVRPTVNMYLFAIHRISSITSTGSTRIYYVKLWDDGTMVRYMIPVIQKSSGTPGMYDLINGVFYNNIGSGTFGYA